jgi:hypothetical protein
MQKHMRYVLLAGTLAAASAVPAFGQDILTTDPSARARICPQFLTKYCVVTRSGRRETVETNPCFARERHWRILHAGACR